MSQPNDFQVLITADEGYTAFEQAVVCAVDRIDMGFRVFDPRTELTSDEGKEIGKTWADLLVFKLNAGVKISIQISDFEPIVRPYLHHLSWKSFSVLTAIAELSENPENLRASVIDHPARVGSLPRLALWPKVQTQLSQTCDELNAMPAKERLEMLRFMPRFTQLVQDIDGNLSPNRKQLSPMMPVTHHQKVAVVDDEHLYIGGLDLNARRMDSEMHHGPAEDTWHDVQLLIRDRSLAKSARRHLDWFVQECAGAIDIEPPAGLLRTLSVARQKGEAYLSPEMGDTGILDRHLELIQKSEKLIYMESQFLRDPVLADALAQRATEAPDLGLICLLPAAPIEVAFEGAEGLDHKYGEYLQAKCLKKLEQAFGDRFFCASPAQPTERAGTDRSVLAGAPIIFVHSKVSIFDDQAALVTSANLNGRSLRWDTELGLEIKELAQVSEIRQRVMGAWLPSDADENFTDGALDTVARWRDLAHANAATSPRSRLGFLLPYERKAAEKFGAPLPGVPAEMV